jgi:hypothetical protein
MVTVVAAELGAATGPVQFRNALPILGAALRFTTEFAVKKPVTGKATPPAPAELVNRYCVTNVPVIDKADEPTVIVCEGAPPSDHEENAS